MTSVCCCAAKMVIAMLAHVDLCSGIGGFALGFQWAGLSRPVLFCDIEEWSRKVLAKHWPDVPISDDVKELASDPRRLVPDCDILTAGYPCQPFSQAGVRRGEEDDRHIWPEIFTIVQAKRPTWCVFENVSGHISLGLDQVLSDLESKGYAVQPFVVPACAVDAPHRRDRVWIVANSSCRRYGCEEKEICTRRDTVVSGSAATANVADTGCQRQGAEVSGLGGQSINASAAGQRTETRDGFADGRQVFPYADSERGCSGDAKRQDASDVGQPSRCQRHDAGRVAAWLPEPPVGRVANGIPKRVDRLKGLGNAIVPQIAMQIGLTIKAVENG
jgi:DNA (cytosine-5)-methyltransferase 1